jgi:hypothetical protein
VLLQDLDLVAVRVLDEKESRHQRAVAVELDDVAGFQPGRLEARMLGIEITDGKGDMAVAGAQVIRLGGALVDGQLDPKFASALRR